MIEKIIIQNFKGFENFDLSFGKNINTIVGNNESGKSTILEAINLALTKTLNGHYLENELSVHIFNLNTVDKFIKSIADGEPTPPPKILIELYFDDTFSDSNFEGTNNLCKNDVCGIKLEILFDEEYQGEYAEIISDKSIKTIPVEYYKINWQTFSGKLLTTKIIKDSVLCSYIDASSIQLRTGTDYYLQEIIRDHLDTKDRSNLSLSYRYIKEGFSQRQEILNINNKLKNTDQGLSNKSIEIALDISQKTGWETNTIPYIENLPYHYAGKGEQNSLKILLALNRRKSINSDIILIEEPENHLSFSWMRNLISKIESKCDGKQIIITTHSTYIINKLGLENLILLNKNGVHSQMKLTELPKETENYFKKLSGYDTLRMVLSRKAILVEGPSDELIIQKAYLNKYSKLPIEDEIDVINIRGLSFLRFLEIADKLDLKINVVTDNDGDYSKNITQKYSEYQQHQNIKICASSNDTLKTLEPQFVECNDLSTLLKIFNKQADTTKEELIYWMEKNKTEWALLIFETAEKINFPDYVITAIS